MAKKKGPEDLQWGRQEEENRRRWRKAKKTAGKKKIDGGRKKGDGRQAEGGRGRRRAGRTSEHGHCSLILLACGARCWQRYVLAAYDIFVCCGRRARNAALRGTRASSRAGRACASPRQHRGVSWRQPRIARRMRWRRVGAHRNASAQRSIGKRGARINRKS